MSPLEELEKLIPKIEPAVRKSRFGEGLQKISDIAQFADNLRVNFRATLDVANRTEYGRRSDHVEAIEKVVLEADTLSKVLLHSSNEDDLVRARALREDLQKSYESLFRSLRGHIERWVEEQFVSQRGYTDLLKKIPQTMAFGLAQEACCNEALRARTVRNAVEMQSIIQRVCEQRETLNTQKESLNQIPGAGNFLEAIAEQRATLADVTPEVMSWLVEMNALETFSVQSSS